MQPATFLGLPDSGDAARVALVCAPYDLTSTWGQGARRGPAALLAASAEVETYEEETGTDLEALPCTVRWPDDPAAFARLSPERMVAVLRALHEDVLARGQLGLGLGGEHSISHGQFAALQARHADLVVLQIDAHLDLRDEYQGSRHNHACIGARFVETGATWLQLGARSCSAAEAARVRDEGLAVWWARDATGRPAVAGEIVQRIGPRPVFVSVDLDGFDPSLVPATGTPEPGGLGWADVCGVLRHLGRACRVVGADITELAPDGNSRTSEFLAARLAAKMLAYFWASA